MPLWNALKGLVSSAKNYVYAKLFNGYVPVFSQFGDSIYASDIVQNCIDVIATECSKLKPRHIRTDPGGMQSVPKGALNRLFKFAPNEMMTTKDFIEKVIWLLYLNYNAFIYPTYETFQDARGNTFRSYTGFYPLNPRQVDFLQDDAGTLFVKLYFQSGTTFTIPYADIIHLRKKFSVNEIMGGGLNGQPDNAALLKVLQINDVAMQGIEKGVKSSLAMRGILNIKTMMDDDGQKAERQKLDKAVRDSDSGIVALDLKGEYIPLKVDPKLIDKGTMEFLQNKALNWFGVSLPILTGDYTDDQYQAFYEKTLEPIIISLGQAFSRTIFTPRELDIGNEIVCYQKDMMYLSTNAKLNLLKTAGEQGLLTNNQKLALLGYPPMPDGDQRTQSLNYIDVKLINQYQMQNKSKAVSGNEQD